MLANEAAPIFAEGEGGNRALGPESAGLRRACYPGAAAKIEDREDLPIPNASLPPGGGLSFSLGRNACGGRDPKAANDGIIGSLGS